MSKEQLREKLEQMKREKMIVLGKYEGAIEVLELLIKEEEEEDGS